MAKILRTEQLSVNGDNIRLTADDGNLIINSVSGDDLTQITSTTKIGQDISSLAVRDTGFDTDVSSLAAGTNSVESMLVNSSKYGVYSLETSNLSTGSGSSLQTINLSGRSFVAKPTITATLTGSSNDPIIAVMISDVSETATAGVYQVTFQFSDELPATGETDQATNYKLNILANVNNADQDLDTIIDSVDTDRDGDGVKNSHDYDADDPSVTSFSDTVCGYDVRVGGTSGTSSTQVVAKNGGIAFILVNGTTAQAEALRDQWNQPHPTESGRSLDIKTFNSSGDELETIWADGRWGVDTVPYTSFPVLRHNITGLNYADLREYDRGGDGASYNPAGVSSPFTAKSTECID